MLKMPSRSHLLCFSIFLVPGLLFAISFYYIAFHHVWPLSRDQWHMYAPYFKQGLWDTLLTPMSTHRHVFPYLFFHIDMEYFHGLNYFLIACGTFFNGLLITLLLSTLSHEATLTSITKYSMAAFIFTSLIWLIDIAQLGWGFMSTQYYLAIFTLTYTVYLADRYRLSNYQSPLLLVSCILCGAISTFSFGMGVLVWPILFLFSWVWKSPKKVFLFLFVSFSALLLLFFMMPGGNEIEGALRFSSINTIRFTFELAAGPVYYLMRSWRILEIDQLKGIASGIGIFASSVGVIFILRLIYKRPALSPFVTLCYTLLLTGLGTAALVSFTRPLMFLDIWVDRYQIWAILFWVGFLPLAFIHLNYLPLKKIILTAMLAFPLLVFPSQLDFGSRLYEYKTRVQESLLYYQVGIPDKEAAIDALHWNWENKISDLSYDLTQLKKYDKNIFYHSPAKHIDGSFENLSKNYSVTPIVLTPRKIRTIQQSDLLTDSYFESLDKNTGYSFYAQLPNTIHWDYVIYVDDKNLIKGLGVKVQHSILPRSNLNNTQKTYNLFAVVKGDFNTVGRWYALKI